MKCLRTATSADPARDDAPPVEVDAVAAFCLSAPARRCFANWSPETLRDYLQFHKDQGTAFVEVQTFAPARVRRSEVRGVGVAWECGRSEMWNLWQAGFTSGHAFRWQPTNPRGGMLFVAEFVAVDGAARAGLCRQMAARFPEWRIKPVWTFRRGIIHRLGNSAMGRMLTC